VDVELNIQKAILSFSRVEIVTPPTNAENAALSGLCSSVIYISYCENENDFNCETREEVTSQTPNVSLIANLNSNILGEKWK
jgi:hypothetical protein